MNLGDGTEARKSIISHCSLKIRDSRLVWHTEAASKSDLYAFLSITALTSVDIVTYDQDVLA